MQIKPVRIKMGREFFAKIVEDVAVQLHGRHSCDRTESEQLGTERIVHGAIAVMVHAEPILANAIDAGNK